MCPLVSFSLPSVKDPCGRCGNCLSTFSVSCGVLSKYLLIYLLFPSYIFFLVSFTWTNGVYQRLPACTAEKVCKSLLITWAFRRGNSNSLTVPSWGLKSGSLQPISRSEGSSGSGGPGSVVSGHKTIKIWRKNTGKNQFPLPPSHRCDFCFCLFNIVSSKKSQLSIYSPSLFCELKIHSKVLHLSYQGEMLSCKWMPFTKVLGTC